MTDLNKCDISHIKIHSRWLQKRLEHVDMLTYFQIFTIIITPTMPSMKRDHQFFSAPTAEFSILLRSPSPLPPTKILRFTEEFDSVAVFYKK